MWAEDEFPELAANEYFCLSVAKKLGMDVPNFELSDDGGALVIERFDLVGDTYLGFEDFCVLNALGTTDKYKDGYETRLFRRMRDFVGPSEIQKSLETLFKLFVLNCAIRNGDAHLKNFGITYNRVNGPAQIAPIYDLVTTSAYLPKDQMALTLNGSTAWPNRKELFHLAQTRSDLSQKKAEVILEETADGMASVAPSLRQYFTSSDNEVGKRMLDAWETGIRHSLGLTKGLLVVTKRPPKSPPRVAKSDGLLLEYLRQRDGSISGTLKSISTTLEIPQSTLSGSLGRLVERGFVQRTSRKITLVLREV